MTRSTRVRHWIAFTLAIGVAGAAGAAASQKLDATLTALARDLPGRLVVKSALVRVDGGQAEPLVETILRFDGDLERVRSEGGVVRSVIGNIATVDIPVSRLAAVAALPDVVSIEASRVQPKRLDRSVPATRADTLRVGTPPTWTAGTGRNVIVGVIDSGIDYRHRDFRNGDGSTRIIGIWDQSATGASGKPPAGYNYGGECTPAMIDAAIAGDAAACVQKDTDGHGTHVAGTAAGNGQATGNGQLAYRMIGMAPSADLLVANGSGNAQVLDAIAWMKAKAAALGRPLVINMSFGSYFGARDGTSNFEQGMSNLAGPGVILVGAAGNEATAPIRAVGTIKQGESVTVGFNIPERSAAAELEIWYPGSNAYGVFVTGPGCAPSPTANPGDSGTVSTPCGGVQITSTAPQVNNDDRQIKVSIGSLQGAPLVKGDWKITLVGTVVGGGSAPFSIICGEDAGGPTFTSHTTPVTTEILTDTSSARRVIAVASYNTRTAWNSLTGPSSDTSSGPVSDISNFSSRGPRRNCSNPAKCPPIMKPEITAPGSKIIAALTVDRAKPTEPSTIEADGVHYGSDGTSMATPHVTGAIALLLQQSPQLTPEAVRQRLYTNVQSNSYSTALPVFNPANPDQPPAPNYTWGYGILDAAKAVTNVVPNYQGLWWNPAESGWGINFAHQGDTVFATWFTYDAQGKPWWLIAVLNKTGAGVYSGTVSTVSGPLWGSVPFGPAPVEAEVGRMTVTFADTTRATVNYTVNGITQTKAVEPQKFGTLPTCTWGAQPNLALATNYTDLWWNANESGWGVNFTHQGDTVFATWFTYDTQGKPWWLIAVLNKTGAGVYSGSVLAVAGQAFNSVPWDPAKISETTVGTATVTFANGNAATFAYTVNGTSQSKAVTRQVFVAPGTTCQ